MANQEQLAILKQGVDVWNKWRDENFLVDIDLSDAKLNGTELIGANFSGSALISVNLSGVDFSGTNLSGAGFKQANLLQANFTGAKVIEANFNEALLKKANFSGADLAYANLNTTLLMESNFENTLLGYTVFGNSDLSNVTGLEYAIHHFPSHVSINTFVLSKGEIPEIFLKGCGLSDVDIEYSKLFYPGLSSEGINNILYKIHDLRVGRSIQISPLFISYSHADGAFVDKLEIRLDEKGIRFWRDIHDMKSGRIETQIDRAIRQNRMVLLILSEQSLQSDWVEHEVRTARALEKEIKRDVLCPVALDDSWKNSSWAKRIMEQITEYNILNFSKWKDDTKFEDAFNKLIDGLRLFY